ncbi:lysine-specific demethylase REF6-like [Juglans microcarpa x Juglans regia]|uniref:lysine-specific demethylase REF6-like n=1 Tax=Juglans microcarpa x Juglans regia TaxID=2249226 RepID=UPI001B7EDE09|nr:lysine-specific demethylase REF6-like [Juglans microcarpa x Juglans regia]
MGASEPTQEVLSWLKSLPLAPEYHPTLAEFQDPISYIFKIEKEASKYGICKIVPPVPSSPKKTAIANLNRSLAARNPGSDSKSPPTFTTRQQQIGFCPRKQRAVQRPVWESGEYYTFQKFEAKAKAFEKSHLKKCCKRGTTPSALDIETLYWKATVDKPFSVEYANDMPGSAFVPFSPKKSREAGWDGVTLGETAWNMRGVSRSNGSLLRFMKEEIPGVTSPMVYVAMMFSWFAWHVEDHDLHSLNYLHMGAGKTWYGVPREAAVAFEEVVRVHGYGGEINPLVTFATLGEKTTVMSPEIFISAGVPCCRLVQNAGEFVVTFPRAYHTGFSHGFNCGEAANIATPEWLRVAKDAAIRRASINYPPMVSHFQLLYDLALALCSRIPVGINEPRSSRLKDKKKGEGETMVKELFVQDVVQNNDLLHILGKGSSVVLLPHSSSDISVCSKLRVGSHLRVNPRLTPGLCSSKEVVKMKSSSLVSDDLVQDGNGEMGRTKGLFPVKGNFFSLYERNKLYSLSGFNNRCPLNSKTLDTDSERGSTIQGDGLSDQRLFSCVTCGILSFACVAIIRPTEPASRYLMSADCSFFNDWVVGSGITSNGFTSAKGDAITYYQNAGTGRMEKSIPDGLYDVPAQPGNYQIQMADQLYEVVSTTESQINASALGLLALNYGNSSDSEEDQDEPNSDGRSKDETDFPSRADETKLINCSSESIHQCDNYLSKNKIYQCDNSHWPPMQDCSHNATGVLSLPSSRCGGEDVPSPQTFDCYAQCGRQVANLNDGSHQTSDRSVECRTDDLASTKSIELMDTCSDPMTLSNITSDHSPCAHDAVKTKLGKAIAPIENTNMSLAPRSDEDSSRMHVFCLEHAVEVEKQLRPIGGVDILLLCHPEYAKIEAEAKLLAEELGIDCHWNDITFRNATKEDENRIQSALDSQEAIHGNGDWAVKLGINLFYSANLSRSTLYSKQMPYNFVIYNAFGRSAPASSPRKRNVCRRRSGRQKKVVAGKWCGKVWMSHQVHPFLVKGDPDHGGGGGEEEEEEEEEERSLQTWTVPDDKLDRKSESDLKHGATTVRKYSRKRKMTVESGSTKKTKCIDREDAVSDYSAEDNYLQQHRRTLRGKPNKTIKRDDSVSDDALNNNFHQLQRRSSKITEVFSDERENVVNDSLVHNSHQQRRRIISGKRPKCFERDDAISDGSLGNNAHQRSRKVTKSKIAKDAFSDDSMEVNSDQQIRRRSRSRAKCIEREDGASDDSFGDISHHQCRRLPKIKKAKGIERESEVVDILRSNSHRQHHRIIRDKQMKPETRQQMKKQTSLLVKQADSRAIKQVTCQPMKKGTPKQMKQQTPRHRNNQSDQNASRLGLNAEEDLEGGPSTRLRQRTPKPHKKTEAKAKEKQQPSRKKVKKNASAVKALAGNNDPKTGHEEAEFVCDIEGCTMSFGSKQELAWHKRNICPVKGCGKKLFSHKYLVQHRRVHMDDRPLRCPWKGCKMTFKWAWARTEHIRVHTGARPYVCGEPGCGQTFRFVSDFSRHKRKTGHSAKKGR